MVILPGHLLADMFGKVFDGQLLGPTDFGRHSSAESLEIVLGHLPRSMFREIVW